MDWRYLNKCLKYTIDSKDQIGEGNGQLYCFKNVGNYMTLFTIYCP